MYFFVYDALTATRRYERRTSQVVLRVNDLELPHDKALTTSLNTVEALVADVLEKNVFETIVAVGDDKTARAAMNTILKHRQEKGGRDVAFGFVPITKTLIGSMLGLPIGARTVPYISRRRRMRIDIGRLNKGFFFGSVIIQSAARFEAMRQWSQRILRGRPNDPIHTHIRVGKLKMEADVAYLSVSNLLSAQERRRVERLFSIRLPRSYPQDGLLQLAILGTERNAKDLTIFQSDDIRIETDINVVASVDNVKMRQHHFQFGIDTKALNVIVGKEREF